MTTEKENSPKITKLFNPDHRRVLKQLTQLENTIKNTKYETRIETATSLLTAIKQEMSNHFHNEEEILFPVLNRYFKKALKKIGGNIRPESPVKVMLLEHKALRIITQNLEAALEGQKMDEASTNVTKFTSLIRSHIFREENVLYVVADARLTEKEKTKIAKAIHRLK